MTGLAEPVGALFGMLFLLPFWTPIVGALLLAAVAGIMVYISFDELLPGAEEYGHHHFAIGGNTWNGDNGVLFAVVLKISL